MNRFALLVSLLTLTLLRPSPSRADVVTDWNAAALNAIRADKTPPPKASRSLAMLHASIYDAINGIDRRYESYVVPSAVPASASRQAAASAAAHRVLVSVYPALAAVFDQLHLQILATLRDSPQKAAGLAWGESVADQILAWRAGDGADAAVAAPVAGTFSDWVPTPPANAAYLLPQWGQLTPFTMTEHAQFRPPGPPPLASSEWAGAFSEVKALGGATDSTRTAEQTLIALFWADGAGTETPPGHWNTIAHSVAAAQGNTLEENARLFALLNLAMADAAIACWDAKYTFHFWRPVTAIRNADLDDNDATQPDPSWTSFIVTPPFPDYTSGHSTFSGAAATVLALFYGTDQIGFTTGSDFLPGVLRSFDSFSAAADEAAISRLYGGIHFRFSNEAGLQAGLRIGEWTSTHYRRPKNNRARD
jgi:hypothetical protein